MTGGEWDMGEEEVEEAVVVGDEGIIIPRPPNRVG